MSAPVKHFSTAAVDTREPVLKARGLIKTFGRVVGLDGVDLDLYPGEVLAIIGDNGAGKSTLVKALTGALTVDSGEIFLDGHPANFTHPDGRPQRRHRNRLPNPGGRARHWTSPATCTSVVKRSARACSARSFGCSTRRA